MSISICWALFNAHPASNPPFTTNLGINNNGELTVHNLNNCDTIPMAVEQIKNLCNGPNYILSPKFTLLYPIYMDAMNTEYESNMLQIAWLIKDITDAEKWGFNRTGGLSGITTNEFY